MKPRDAISAVCARSRFLIALCLLALLAACAPVTYNRYQPAQTMGEGQYKLAASAEFGKEMVANVQADLASKMDAKMLNWALAHSQNGATAAGQVGVETLSWVSLLGLAGLGDPVPQANIYFAYGVTNNLDLEASVSTTLYFRFNAKAQMLRFGSNGAFSIAPGIGYVPFNESNVAIGNNVKDAYSGYAATVELPFLVGWQFRYASPYLGALVEYNHVGVHFTRADSDVAPTFHGTVNADYDIFSVGPAVGVQLKFGGFIMTPELVMLYAHGAGGGLVLPHSFFISPGLQLGGQW